ncbi:hypothetical protein ACSBR2_033510 [Camellia fascicularis]
MDKALRSGNLRNIKLSFVGHSTGNVIIRTALTGLWLLKKLRGTQCIHQLTYTNDPDIQNTFFHKLSKQKTLENFKIIVLLSSPQDGYVPYHPARIELCQAASGDNSKKGKVFLEMLNDCLDQIQHPRVSIGCSCNVMSILIPHPKAGT